MQTIYSSYQSPLGVVHCKFDGQEIFACIGDYCHCRWVSEKSDPFGGLKVENRAATGYGANHPHAGITLNWWSNQVPNIVASLFNPAR
jgi:hypothetical protein